MFNNSQPYWRSPTDWYATYQYPLKTTTTKQQKKQKTTTTHIISDGVAHTHRFNILKYGTAQFAL